MLWEVIWGLPLHLLYGGIPVPVLPRPDSQFLENKCRNVDIPAGGGWGRSLRLSRGVRRALTLSRGEAVFVLLSP